ncbi:hypothetical protein THAOC_29716 [Thalassiosira oceanica]|uniref:Uncharacterized protein n=1 Tax=Thalassiosira oceanica TaxID=159749 RepID=K0RQM6_THAOC|nr:hypothetical protein THAOC_29716 [Thalassiosira oceanica]|eukprot:EJK51141.1 hypothetical protein THAOC_29716 [Thalassiosira oceanica]
MYVVALFVPEWIPIESVLDFQDFPKPEAQEARRLPISKTPKKTTKLSPAEKKDRKRLRERARMANKRNDPAYLLREAEKKAKKREDSDVRDKENAQQRARQAKKRADPDVRDEENAQQRARQAKKRADPDVRDEENAQKRARRAEDGEYRDALQVRDVNRKRTARNEKRDRRVDLSKGFVDEEHTTFALWRATEKGSDDMRDRDENGRHYLGRMDVRCGYCGAIGFRGELKTKGDDGDGNKVQNFGSLCCCKGKIGGTVNYELGDTLENLYTSTDVNALHFRANARVNNNSMAMSSLACEHGWRQRFHNNKCEGMLTSQGQLLRKMGPLTARDGERPKCIQAYFYGADQATAYRMMNCKVSIPSKERETYKSVFKALHRTLLGAGNKYLDAFMSVKDYIETKLKDKVWDVRLSITANLIR